MASPSSFDSASFLDHLADAAESISQVISDQDVLENQARCEFGQLQRVEFEDKMLESSQDAQKARYLHETAESHNLQLAAEALAQGCGVELSRFHSIYKELCCLLNIGDLPLEPVTTSTVAPMDIWGGPSSESFPFEMKSDSTPNSLFNFIPSLDTTSLPSTLVKTRNTSPVVIFLSGHLNAYFPPYGSVLAEYTGADGDRAC
ncbi:hypothetical protein GYMLUDRAFT_251723 [Collybiopsis luxurians FD-317 M1]|uniref:Uncharacterized protein n=1 Tax=Collybiopsis luxurians FD-317 M1 TaxID=944289 RepID=A0A0D0C1W2_9AGAR|nr:hypothetical protein GYMLUDRAFT_251723 [Collybiopsis luxurians FD-317 M1]